MDKLHGFCGEIEVARLLCEKGHIDMPPPIVKRRGGPCGVLQIRKEQSRAVLVSPVAMRVLVSDFRALLHRADCSSILPFKPKGAISFPHQCVRRFDAVALSNEAKHSPHGDGLIAQRSAK